MKKIQTAKAPAAIGPYSQGIDAGAFVYTSGQLGVDPATGALGADVTEQAELSLQNIEAILAEAGLGMGDVVKTLIFLADMNDFAAVNAVYAKHFAADPLPARSCVQVAALPQGGLIEIEAVAVRK